MIYYMPPFTEAGKEHASDTSYNPCGLSPTGIVYLSMHCSGSRRIGHRWQWRPQGRPSGNNHQSGEQVKPLSIRLFHNPDRETAAFANQMHGYPFQRKPLDARVPVTTDYYRGVAIRPCRFDNIPRDIVLVP